MKKFSNDQKSSPLSLSFATNNPMPVLMPMPTSARYVECLRNHAAATGGHALDGCGEFTPAGLDALRCGACSCHRSFHRREEWFEEERRRFRTKFTVKQKERMAELAERVGWRLKREDEAAVERLCRETGVTRRVFKVWMHNNKHTLAKKLP